jgi:hypothetical protein
MLSASDVVAAAVRSMGRLAELIEGYGKSFDTGPPEVGAGSLTFCRFSRLLIVFLGLPASFPNPPAIAWGPCSCGGVSVDTNRNFGVRDRHPAQADKAACSVPK